MVYYEIYYQKHNLINTLMKIILGLCGTNSKEGKNDDSIYE